MGNKGKYIAFFLISILLFIGIFLFSFPQIAGQFWNVPFFLNKTPTPKITLKTIEKKDVFLSEDEKFLRAQAFFQNGLYSKAIADLQEILKQQPLHEEAWKMLIDAQIARRDFTSAEDSARSYLVKNPTSLEVQVKRIEILIKKGSFDEARTALGSLPENSIERIFYEGLLASFFSDHKIAKKKFSLLKDSPFAPKANALLHSYEEFSFFPDSNEDHLSALLGQNYNDFGFYHLTIEKLRPTLEKRPDYRDAWILTGYAYLSLGKFHTAQNALEKAVSLDPSKPESAYFLGLTLSELGLYEESAVQFKNALTNKFQPETEGMRRLAETLVQAKKYEESLEYFEKILQNTSPELNDFIRPIWITLDMTDLKEKALDFAKTAIKKYPEEAMSYNLLGWALLENNSFELAEKALQKGESIDPNLTALYLNFGKLRKKEEKYEDALSFFEKTYNMDKFGTIGSLAAKEYNDLVETMKTKAETKKE